MEGGLQDQPHQMNALLLLKPRTVGNYDKTSSVQNPLKS